MYNKIFTKILDSSIWLEPDATRIVWLTCIAAMDEDGFVAFASPANLAHRANVTLTAALAALETLEGPDANSSDPDNDGRRVERVPGGWLVLNAAKYRDIVTREVARASTRRRVQRHRDLKRASNAVVTVANGAVTKANVLVTPSEAVSEAVSEAKAQTKAGPLASLAPSAGASAAAFGDFWRAYPRKVGKADARRWWTKHAPAAATVEAMGQALAWQVQSEQWLREGGRFIPHPATWLQQGRWQDEPTAAPPRALGGGMGHAWEPFQCPHDPECHGRSACALRTQLDAMKEARHE